MSNALAPIRPISSCTVITSSMPACGMPSRTTRRMPSIMPATVALLSAPRIVGWRLTTYSPSIAGSIGAVIGTVSTCALKKSGVPAAVAGMRA